MVIKPFSSHIQRKEMEAVLSCLVTEKVGPGDLNLKLLQAAKDFFSVDGATAFRSPSIALAYALKCLDLPKGSGVIVSALAPFWHYQTLVDLGYVPLVVDVSPETAQMRRDSLETALQKGGRLILLYEPLGFLPDFSFFSSLNVPIIEDISQNAGSYYAFGEKLEDVDEKNEVQKKLTGTFGAYSIVGLEEQDVLTAGGGALLVSSARREWIVQKNTTENAPATDILPDINSALAYIQFKEFVKSEAIRKNMQELYIRALMQGRHKNIVQENMQEGMSAVPVCFSFPVVLSSNYKEVKQYAARKEIEITLAFENTIIATLQDQLENCIQAKSLFLRCVLFPLYPRLGMTNASKIAKVLSTLP